MKVLVVSPVPAYPTSAGNRARVLGLISGLQALGHEVHLAFLRMTATPEAWDRAAHEALVGAGRLHERPDGPVFRTWYRIRRRLRRDLARLGVTFAPDTPLDAWFDAGHLPALRALDRREAFDAVIVEYVFASRAFAAFDRPLRKVLDTHDTFGDRSIALPGRTAAHPWFRTTMAAETEGFRRADVVVAIQPAEAEAYRARLAGTATSVVTVSHFVEEGAARAIEDRPAAVFLASENEINRNGLDLFVATILPRIRAARPDFRLILAGGICNGVTARPGVETLGRVERPADALCRAPVAINPVWAGTGVAIKILDALATGVPVVTTRAGGRGLGPDVPGVTLVDDDDPQGFADAVLRAVDAGPAGRAGLAGFARRWNETQAARLAATLEPARFGAMDRTLEPGPSPDRAIPSDRAAL